MGIPGGCCWLAKSGLAVAVVMVSVDAVGILCVFEEVRELPEVVLLLALFMGVLEGVGGESV